MRSCLRAGGVVRRAAPSRRLDTCQYQNGRSHTRMLAMPMTEHSLYLEEIAVSQSPKRLGAFIKVLQAKGGKPLLPTDRAGLHPLLIPLVFHAAGGTDTVTCLLRWPQPSLYKAMPLPVVKMQRGAPNMTLLARSVDEQLHRLLAEENAAALGAGPLAEAAGADGQELFKEGDIEAAGLGGKLQMYIIRKVGMFPDICESLSLGHLQRGDKTSALVAGEWYMRNGFFPGWARPYEFSSELLTGLDRHEEARDLARVALRLPWWTLQKGFVEVQAVAQVPGSPEEVKQALSEEAAAAAQAQVTKFNYREPKSAQQVALENASKLMDLVAAGALPTYDTIREELASLYKAAGLNDVANFITAAS